MSDLIWKTIELNQSSEYKGFTLNASYDDGLDNPLEVYECMPMALVFNASTSTPILRFNEKAVDLELSADEVEEKGETLLPLLKCDSLDKFSALADPVAAINEELSQLDTIDDMQRLCEIKGCSVLRTTITNRSVPQGSSFDTLMVGSPAWRKEQGEDYWLEQMEIGKELLEDWFSGDVYLLEVIDDDGEEVFTESCFYGDHKTSGLNDRAIDIVEGILLERLAA